MNANKSSRQRKSKDKTVKLKNRGMAFGQQAHNFTSITLNGPYLTH